jgi:hypothetical protein
VTAPVLPRQRREAASVEWRRRYASYACPPDADGFRDPLGRRCQPDGPSTYSLPTTARYRHAAALAAQGWQEWELRRRFKLRAVPTP